MWGVGGSGGRAAPTTYTGVAGGGGGYTTGSMTGDVYYMSHLVGNASEILMRVLGENLLQ